MNIPKPPQRNNYWHCLLFIGLLSFSNASPALELTDSTGQTFLFAQTPQRIISLAPNLTENLFAIGAEQQLIATVAYSDYPAGAKSVPRLGDAFRLDVEQVFRLQPDLVLVWQSGIAPSVLERLQKLGLRVFQTEVNRLEELRAHFLTLGKLTGKESAAAKAVQKIDAVLQQGPTSHDIPVFYQLWEQPIMTVNDQHIISDVIRFCGGRNVFGNVPSLTPTVSLEAVIKAKPAVILASGQDAARPAWLDTWRQWQQIPAVQNDALYAIDPDLLHRPSLRLLDGLQQVCAHLQTQNTSNSR